uniref:Thioredoxin domain-containing protein n=1 Tax=Bicosoecida sp. CB-2014 TaxID=1486930 RepID=A0A7S1CD91_9STRA|mmetsp:Transcript_20808/g.73450  ORF Transcript_20808/g.73450 Transcript_20808/m.73450 type:complete len:189 (+) Transcript_20808:78-644(+)
MAQEAMVAEVVGQHMLASLEAAEEKLDDELHRMEHMDEDDIEAIRARRLEQLQKKRKLELEWASKGHGKYREIPDQKAFFEEVKASKRVVVHFYRAATRRCEIVDRHMDEIARKHPETKFCKVDAEKSPFLCERLNIWMLPTLVLVKDGKTEHSIVGFDDFGGHDDFGFEVFEAVLAAHGMLLESYMT